MSEQHLVQMANDIARFFVSNESHANAVAGVANHLRRSWTPRMLQKLQRFLHEGGEGLDPLAREAFATLPVATRSHSSADADGSGATPGS